MNNGAIGDLRYLLCICNLPPFTNVLIRFSSHQPFLLVVVGRYPIFFINFRKSYTNFPLFSPHFCWFTLCLYLGQGVTVLPWLGGMWGIRLGASVALVRCYCDDWARFWHGNRLLSLPGAGVAWLWYFLILLPGHFIWCLRNTLSYKSFSVVLPAKIFSR